MMRQLSHHPDTFEQEGKMYGILIVRSAAGYAVLKAFSGELGRSAHRDGWVPPIPGRQQIALDEARTLQELEQIKQRLIDLKHLPERLKYRKLLAQFEHDRQALVKHHQQKKHHRHQQRQSLSEHYSDPHQHDELAIALEALDEESRQDGIELRHLKRHYTQQRQPLQQAIADADAEIQSLKRRRKSLSCQLQAQLHQAYVLQNFAGQSQSVTQLMADPPSGTGDCCAPKLLHYAAIHHLTPIAIAEFWWGPAAGDKQPGHLYGPCAERCQPLMGFLLSGLSEAVYDKAQQLPIVYEDQSLLVINKPTGLLSVPGRRYDRQDSVLSRLRSAYPYLTAVHRLDQDTSGLLILSKTPESDRHLRHQFQHQQIHKTYDAIVDGYVTPLEGNINLPLWGNPSDRPRQVVDWQRGKPSLTHYQVIHQEAEQTRLILNPKTGRTHQLRVHLAVGLQTPIQGDHLYGIGAGDRLMLHARILRFIHPHHQTPLNLSTEPAF
jgi:tRNA pseudouridine32 synthase/23S rRNA pseudouridine746 synthase